MGIFSSESKSESKVTPYDQGHVNDLLARIKAMGGTPMEMFPDQMYAGMDPAQMQALDMRRDFAGGMGQQITDPTMGAWQQSLSAPDVANNPYVQGMIGANERSLNRNFQEMMPGIDATMLGVNERLGGSGQGVAQGVAARGTQEALANANAGMMMDAYGQGLDQQKFAMGAAPGMAGLGLMPSDITMGIGDIERAEAQKGLSEDIARFNFGQQEPLQRLQNELNLSQGLTLPFASSESKSESSPSMFSNALNALSGGFSGAMGVQGGGMMGSGGMLSNWMGGGGGGTSMGGYGAPASGGGSYGSALSSGGGMTPASFLPMTSMFAMSDRRLKSNIVHIGYTPGGQRVYEYDIFDTHQVGVMADESPADAVIKHPSGYDMVDYSRIV